MGRNFANKLWNATRFVLMKLAEFEATQPKVQFESEDTEYLNSIAERPLEITRRSAEGFSYKPATTLADKWIMSRANRAALDIRRAFDAYEINEVTKLIYDFVWKDYCDWYLEVVKVQPESTPLAVEILEGSLRLIHPIMPFVTEELWHALTEEPEHVLMGKDDFITGDKYKLDDEAEKKFEFVQRTIEAIRLLRASNNFAPSKSIELVIASRSDEDAGLLNEARTIIEKLTRAASIDVRTGAVELSSTEYASELVGGRAQVFLKLEQRSEADKQKERERLQKELERITGQLNGVVAKLGNEGFVARAPEQVIAKEREKEESYREQIQKLEATLSQL
ncbi:MAG TPA: class I tRNA ligase family protein [Candidatus Kapabacteria bacterium]|nr:class I tRNA ligase family protein [Candidatus Kapabacteria bacterium]